MRPRVPVSRLWAASPPPHKHQCFLSRSPRFQLPCLLTPSDHKQGSPLSLPAKNQKNKSLLLAKFKPGHIISFLTQSHSYSKQTSRRPKISDATPKRTQAPRLMATPGTDSHTRDGQPHPGVAQRSNPRTWSFRQGDLLVAWCWQLQEPREVAGTLSRTSSFKLGRVGRSLCLSIHFVFLRTQSRGGGTRKEAR